MDSLSGSSGSSQDGYIQGYKDVPSLAVIREKVGVSILTDKDGPIAVEVSPPDTASDDGSDRRKKGHPLKHAWSVGSNAGQKGANGWAL